MKATFLSIGLLLTLITSSCKKLENSSAPVSANATIINSGPIAADGCGWLIKLNDNSEYSPVNLIPGFQQDQLKVNVTYTLLSTNTSCGSVANNPGVRQIKLNNIQKAN
jgi:hypothetical protein